MSAADIDDILGRARQRTFGRGAIVFHQGDPGISLHVVSAGRFALRIGTPEGQVCTLRIYGRGEVFGRGALPSVDPVRMATGVALEPGKTWELSTALIAEMRARHAGTNDALLALLANELSTATQRLLDVTFIEAPHRVRQRLAELTAKYDTGPDGCVVGVTQEDLAGLASTTRATVNRVLVAEERLGTVALRRGAIIVRDVVRLGRRHD